MTLKIPYKGKYFIGYKEAIANKESLGRYKKINSIGYLGKYQFGTQTLKSIGIDDSSDFLETRLCKNKLLLCCFRRISMS